MRKMGLDIGAKNIGVAISDPLCKTSQGLTTVKRSNFSREVRKLKELIENYQVDEVIVGIPLNLNGSSGPQTRMVKKYAKKLSSQLELPIKCWDERLTTLSARKALLQANVRRAQRKMVIDKVAATLILQGYLDSLRRGEGFKSAHS
ncbi:MAG: Holliday junction resolvase RuvX [Actinomycetota bacterium]